MTTIDERIVEMRFDNKQFEAETKKSMNTLERLKASLNGLDGVKGLQVLDKAVTHIKLDGIHKGVEILQKRFSALGIAGKRVIENLTDSIMNKLGSAIKFIEDRIVSGGINRALNIENAHFQLQALLKDEEKVQAVMDNASKSVDGTAYAYDEAAKAASQFAASGIQAGEEMMSALRGIVGVAAMTNSEYVDIARIFTTVAGNGRLMGDQLLQLSSRGLNAASTIAEFFNGVNDGSIEASENVTALVNTISNGVKTTEADIRELVTTGQISFEIFSEAMTNAFADSAERANETFTGAFSNLKAALARIGQGFISPLIEQNSEVVKLFGALRLKINEIKSELVFDKELGNAHALSNEFTTFVLAVAEFTRIKIENTDLTKGFELFESAIEGAANALLTIGSYLAPFGKALARSFLNFSIDDMIGASNSFTELVKNMRPSVKISKDLEDGFKGMCDVIKTLVGIGAQLIGVILPINRESSGLGESVIGLFGNLGRLLSKISEMVRESKILHRSIKSIGFVLSLFSKGIEKLFDTTDKIYVFIRNSETLKKIVSFLSDKIEKIGKIIGLYFQEAEKRIKIFSEYLGKVIPKKAFKLSEEFKDLMGDILKIISGRGVSKDSSVFLDFIEKLLKAVKGFAIGKGIFEVQKLVDMIKELNSANTISDKIDVVQDKLRILSDWATKNVLPVFQKIFGDFTFGKALTTAGGLGIATAMIKLASGFKEVTSSVKGVFNSVPKVLNEFGNTLEAYQKRLKAEQLKDIAEAIILIAGAIALLTLLDPDKVLKVSIGLGVASAALLGGLSKLSGADGFKTAMIIRSSGIAIKQIGLALLTVTASIAGIYYMYKKDKNAFDESVTILGKISAIMVGVSIAMAVLLSVFKSGGSQFAKIGKAIFSVSTGLYIIVSAVNKLFKMDVPEDYEMRLRVLRDLFIALGGLILAIGVTNFLSRGVNPSRIAGPIVALSIMLYTMVSSLKKLFKIDLPDDYKKKLKILTRIFVLMGGLVLAIGIANRIQTTSLGFSSSINGLPIFALAILLESIVSSVKRILTMNLPDDYEKRFHILNGIFKAMYGLVIVMGIAGRLSGGAFKAAGSILSLTAVILTAVISLGILCLYPKEKMIAGAVGLGIVLLAIGGAIGLASKTDVKAYKNVLAMAATIGAITASLGVLSFLEFADIAKGAIALGGILLIFAKDLKYASMMTDEHLYDNLKVMAIIIGEIAISLLVLAFQPWEKLLSASAAMSAVLLSLSYTMSIISSRTGLKPEKIKQFLKATIVFVPIAVAIGVLAFQPWEKLLSAGAAISMVLLTFANTMSVISSKTGLKPEKIDQFLKATLAIVPIGAAIGLLAFQPWPNLLASAVALSATLATFSGVMTILSKVNISMTSLAPIGVAVLGVVAIALSLIPLAKQDWRSVLAAAGGVSLVLISMTGALSIASLIGTAAPAALAGIGLLDLFIADLALVFTALGAIFQNKDLMNNLNSGLEIMGKLGEGLGNFVGGIVNGVLSTASAALPEIGKNLSDFMSNGKIFFDGLNNLDGSSGANAKQLAAAILVMTAADLLNQIKEFLTGDSSLPDFAIDLSTFMVNLTPFLIGIKMIDPKMVKSIDSLVNMMMKLTVADLIEGIVSFIKGDNNSALSSFGEELVKFGPSISKFASQVKGISAESVQGASDAANILAEMKNNLPDSGGLKAKIFGDKNLSEFAEELLLFGPAISVFALQVKGLDSGAVENAANAGMILGKLKDNLPEDNGWMQKVFGSKSLEDFGNDLVDFGTGIWDYYCSVKGIVTSKVNAVSIELKKLIDIANKASDSDFSGLTAFSTGLSSLAENGLRSFYNIFEKSDNEVIKTVNGLMTRVSSKLRETESLDLTTPGANSIKSLIQSINDNVAYAFYGIKFKMEDLGENISSGVAKGITDNNYKVANAMADLAQTVDRTFRVSLEIHSPSRVIERSAKHIPEAVPIGINKGANRAIEAASNLGKDVGEAVSGGFDLKGANIGDKVISGLTGLKDYVGDKISSIGDSNVIDKAVDAITDKVTNGVTSGMEDAGKAATKSANTAVTKTSSSTIKTAVKTVKAVSKQFKSVSFKEFYSTGMTIGEIISDLSKNAATATDKAFLVAYKSQKKILDALNSDINTGAEGVKSNIIEKTNVIAKTLEQRAAEVQKLREKQAAQEEKLQSEVDAKQQAYEQAKQAYESKIQAQQKEKTASQLKEEMKAAKEELRIAKAQQKAMKELYEQNLSEEDKYWNKLLKKKKKGIESADYANMSLQEFQMKVLQTSAELVKSYTDQLSSTRDQIMNSIDLFSAVTDEAKEQLLENRDEIMDSLDWFSEVEQKEPVSKESLLSYAEDQVNTLAKYYEVYDSLMTKLAGTKLGEYVAQLGVNNIAELEAMLSMTDQELAEYAELYGYKLENSLIIANRQAQETAEKVSKETLQMNLESQVEQRKEYIKSVNELLKRTGDSNLSDFIRTLGVDNQAEINAMLSMTDEELDRYMSTYEDSLKSAEGLAKIQLVDLQKDVEAQLQELFGTKKKISLFDFSDAYDGTMKSINKYLKKIKEGKAKEKLQNGLSELETQIKDGVKTTLDAVEPTAKESGENIGGKTVSGIKKVMKNHQTVMADQVDTYIDNANSKQESAQSTGQALATNMVTGIESVSSGFYTAGANSADGFIDGVISRLGAAFSAGMQLAEAAMSGTTTTLDINSPSKEMYKLGDFTGIGFVRGLLACVAMVIQASEEIGNVAKDTLSDSWKDVTAVVTDDMIKMDPIIKPRVDMSLIEGAARDINALFNQAVAIAASNIPLDVKTTQDIVSQMAKENSSKQPIINNSYELTQNNNSPKALSAIEIYRQTRNQFSQLQGVLNNDKGRYHY